MIADKQPKRITPPYATPAGLRLFFEKIKKVKPAQLTTKWAEDNDLPFADAVVNTVKFLGASDKDGNLTGDFGRLRLEGAPFQAALSELVTRAYEPIFTQIDDIGTIGEGDLNNAFKTAYDVGSPGRYVRPFLTLCELAGLRSGNVTEAKPRQTASKGQVTVGPRGPTVKTSAAARTAPRRKDREESTVQVVLRLDVPWDAPVEDVRARIRALTEIGELE